MKRSLIVFAVLLFVTGRLDAAELFGRNTEVPFAYRSGGERSWQLTDQPVGTGERMTHSSTLPDGLDVQLGRNGSPDSTIKPMAISVFYRGRASGPSIVARRTEILVVISLRTLT